MPPMSENQIHPSALLGKGVKLGTGNRIGPNVIFEDGVEIGSGNVFYPGAYIAAGTTIGNDNEFHMHAVIGHTPQDLAFKNDPTYTRIGNGNKFREFVTIHRGTKAGTATEIGNQNFLMAYCHVAHNCRLGNNIIMVNQASLTGHIEVEDKAFLSGMTGFHQFTRIGTLAMVSALSACNKDIPPYFICGGRPGVALGINVVGMRRAGFSAAVREEVKQSYKLLYRSGLNITQAVSAIKDRFSSPEVLHLVKFIESSKRGIVAGSKAEMEGEEDYADEDTLKPKK